MISEKIHVYFVPGLAASVEIFRNIKLPEDIYVTHIIEWKIPKKKEPLSVYAKRLAEEVKEKDAVLIGVSFGGVVVQAMNEHLDLRKLILISSVKCRSELPRRLRFLQRTGLYRLAPTSLIINAKDLTRFAIGPRSKKRLQLYNEYLHVRDKVYMDWAISNMVNFNRKTPIRGIAHLHGDQDVVFPAKHIKNAILCPGGTHIMILNKARWIVEKLNNIITN
jgi:pimeloyl-ACP methyl ester carboxylesterase